MALRMNSRLNIVSLNSFSHWAIAIAPRNIADDQSSYLFSTTNTPFDKYEGQRIENIAF
jgi:hypothetical protein